MLSIEEIASYLGNYNGRPITIMEVCGSHTAAISKFGIKGILSDKIRLISGPGCPVCVTPSGYIDKLIELSRMENTKVLTFGDMLRVPGSKESLASAKAPKLGEKAANVDMVYSPMEVVSLATANPDTTFIFAAVGFETTAPVYTLLLDEVIKLGINNVKILTSLKTMPHVIEYLLDNEAKIDGFIAPGHVCAITGSNYFLPLAQRYDIPFSVCGFEARELLIGIYGLVKMIENNEATVKNFYPAVVEENYTLETKTQLDKYFDFGNATWRGMGEIVNSGLYLKEEFLKYDAGSMGLDEDLKANKACACGEILMGKKEPKDCPLFKKVCNPSNPQGACMVSYEGSCYHAFRQ